MNTGRIIVAMLAVLVFGTDAAAWVQARTSFGAQGIYWTRRAIPVVLQVGGRGASCPDRGLWGTFGPCAEDVIRHARTPGRAPPLGLKSSRRTRLGRADVLSTGSTPLHMDRPLVGDLSGRTR